MVSKLKLILGSVIVFTIVLGAGLLPVGDSQIVGEFQLIDLTGAMIGVLVFLMISIFDASSPVEESKKGGN